MLKNYAEEYPDRAFIMPRPGCGEGRLTWEQVRPLLVDLPDNCYVVNR